MKVSPATMVGGMLPLTVPVALTAALMLAVCELMLCVMAPAPGLVALLRTAWKSAPFAPPDWSKLNPCT